MSCGLKICGNGSGSFPSNVSRGMRMNPTVQQGGTQTIQQSIYLTHFNPCGFNLLVFVPRGAIKITFFQLKQILDATMNHPDVQQKYLDARQAGTDFIYHPTGNEQRRFLFSLMKWAEEAYKNIPDIEFPGYRWRLALYDFNGAMIWDSFSQILQIVKEPSPGVYDWEYLPLVEDFESLPPTVVTVENPFTKRKEVQLYGISKYITDVAFLDRSDPRCERVTRSSFIVNQIPLAESVMCVSSLLTDPANTRVFGFTNYGFSARQNVFNSHLIGYHCAYAQDIYTIEEKPTLIEEVIMRLSLESKPLTS